MIYRAAQTLRLQDASDGIHAAISGGGQLQSSNATASGLTIAAGRRSVRRGSGSERNGLAVAARKSRWRLADSRRAIQRERSRRQRLVRLERRQPEPNQLEALSSEPEHADTHSERRERTRNSLRTRRAFETLSFLKFIKSVVLKTPSNRCGSFSLLKRATAIKAIPNTFSCFSCHLAFKSVTYFQFPFRSILTIWSTYWSSYWYSIIFLYDSTIIFYFNCIRLFQSIFIINNFVNSLNCRVRI